MLILTDQEYNKKMEELGLVKDKDYGKYFLGDMAFLMNIDDNVSELGDLVKFNSNNHLTYMSQVLMDFSSRGAELVIGPGTIDEYGIKYQKALYCTNYKKLFPKEECNSKRNK